MSRRPPAPVLRRGVPALGAVLWLALAPPPARAGALARVELLADDPGQWLIHELPMMAARPGPGLLAYGAQIQPVWTLGPVELGTSLAAQTLQWAPTLQTFGDDELGAVLGVQTRLGLPVGPLAALSWAHEGVWFDLGVSARADASWARPQWRTWSVVPAVGVGWVPPARRR